GGARAIIGKWKNQRKIREITVIRCPRRRSTLSMYRTRGGLRRRNLGFQKQIPGYIFYSLRSLFSEFTQHTRVGQKKFLCRTHGIGKGNAHRGEQWPVHVFCQKDERQNQQAQKNLSIQDRISFR